MRQCGSHFRRVLAVSCGLAATAAVVAWAGESVTFSGRRTDPRSTVTTRTPANRLGIQNPLGSFDRNASSLQGVVAPPFASPKSAPLTPRERELLDQRRDWIMQNPENRLGNSDEVNRAFGVRDYSPEAASKEKSKESDQDKGTLTRYYEKLESDESDHAAPAPREKSEESNSLSPLGMEPLPAYGGYDSFPGPGNRSGTGDDPMSPRLNDMSAGLRGDPFGATIREAGRWPRPFEADRPGTRRSALSVQGLAGADSTSQSSGVERLLGGSPIDTTFNRNPVSSLDPVTAYPDPTREAMNPVVAPPVTSLGSPLQAATPGRDRPLPSSVSSPLRDLGGNALRSSFGSITPTGPRVERRTLNSIKVQLEAPRRSF